MDPKNISDRVSGSIRTGTIEQVRRRYLSLSRPNSFRFVDLFCFFKVANNSCAAV